MNATAGRRPLVAGNWKMHGLMSSVSELRAMIAGMRAAWMVEVWVCPPATLISKFAEVAKGSSLSIGAQDCCPEKSGAFTGDISAEMLADSGARAVILGHSERRKYHGETDADVRTKIAAAWRAGLMAIACIGETEAERQQGRTLPVIERQLEESLPDGVGAQNLVVAYEPVWAIGTGRTPTAADIAEVHRLLRERLVARFGETGKAVRTLYGGSISPKNAADLFSIDGVDGGLVGGASLKAADFLAVLAPYGSGRS